MTRGDRILAVSEFRLGSHRAHAINVVKTAGGFARLGHRVTLLCRRPEAPDAGRSVADLLALYAEPGLDVEYLEDAPEWRSGESAAEPALAGAVAARRARELGVRGVYARHFEAAVACRAAGVPTVMETHSHPGDPRGVVLDALRATRMTPNPLSIVTISPVLARDYASRGADHARITLVPDGVDLDLFGGAAGPSPFRDGSGIRAVYCGHLYDYKGIPTILDAARLDAGIDWHLVGGTPEDLERVRASAAGVLTVTLHGHVPHARVPRYLRHADVLVLPPSAKHPSAAWTSPVKLGEYLASDRPVVASRVPGLLAWVDAPAVRWFTPDEPGELVRAVRASAEEPPAYAVARRSHAKSLAQRFGYANRARSILEALGSGRVDAARISA